MSSFELLISSICHITSTFVPSGVIVAIPSTVSSENQWDDRRGTGMMILLRGTHVSYRASTVLMKGQAEVYFFYSSRPIPSFHWNLVRSGHRVLCMVLDTISICRHESGSHSARRRRQHLCVSPEKSSRKKSSPYVYDDFGHMHTNSFLMLTGEVRFL